VTNPPFSLFREYIGQLFEYGKKFLIIGNMNAVTYKEVFPYIKNGELWSGMSLHGVKAHFYVPDEYNGNNVFYDDGKRIAKVNNAIWFTNLETNKKENPTPICKKYNGHEDEYPKYDNYDAIECAKVANLPIDLPIGSVVGVPITVVDKIASDGLIYFDDGESNQGYEIVGHEHDLNGDGGSEHVSQFEIAGGGYSNEYSSSVSNREYVDNERSERELLDNDRRETEICESIYQAYKIVGNEYDLNIDFGRCYVNGKRLYSRILIQRIK